MEDKEYPDEVTLITEAKVWRIFLDGFEYRKTQNFGYLPDTYYYEAGLDEDYIVDDPELCERLDNLFNNHPHASEV